MNDKNERTISEVREWLVARIARRLSMPAQEIPTDQPVTRLGIDSTEAVVISGELQEWLGRRIPPTVIWDHPTIDSLAEHLGE